MQVKEKLILQEECLSCRAVSQNDENGCTNSRSIRRKDFVPKPWVLILLNDFIHLFVERGEGRDKKKERNISV